MRFCCKEISDGRHHSRRNWRRIVETRSWPRTKSSIEAFLLGSLYVDSFGFEVCACVFEVYGAIRMRDDERRECEC